MDVRAEVAGGGFVNGGADRGEIWRELMLESVLAYVAKKFLQEGNAYEAGTAEGFEGVVGKRAFAHVTADFPLPVIGRKTRKAHGAGFHLADAGSKGIFRADRARDDFLKIHSNVREETLRNIAAAKANCFVGIIGVVVVPIEQRTGSLGSQLQRVH